MAQNLDPDLQLYDGPQFLANGKPNFSFSWILLRSLEKSTHGQTGSDPGKKRKQKVTSPCLKKIICWVYTMRIEWELYALKQ